MKAFKISSSFVFLILVTLFIFSANTLNAQQSASKNSIINRINNGYNVSKNIDIPIAKRIENIDISYNLAKLNNIDSLALKALSKKTSIFGEIKAYDSAIFYTEKLKEYALKTKDTPYLAKAHNKLGLYYKKASNPFKSFKNYNESKKYYLFLNDSTQVGRKSLNQAIIQNNLSDYLGSEKTAIDALKYLKPIENKKYIASAYNVLAINSKAQNNYQEAIYWYDKAIKETQNPSDIIVYKNNLALVYLSLKKYKEGIKILSDLSKSDIQKNTQDIVRINNNLYYAKWLENEQYNPTAGLLQNLSIRLAENDLKGAIDSYTYLAKYYKVNDQAKAIEYTLKALENSKKIHSTEGELEALRFLIDMKPTHGYKTYVESYLSITDSINDMSLKAKNQFAKIKYDTEKIRDANLNLNAKIARDSLRIAKETYRRNLGILISSILIITVGFIVHNWRQHIKIASFNAVTKTEKRISKKVHDEMANDISNIKTLVKNHVSSTNHIKDKLINMLDISYTNARDIASETGEIIFSDSFGIDLKNLLMQHNNENIKIILSISALNQLKIDQHKKNALYRTLQELMVNMNKHSMATRVIIAHKKERRYHEIRYSDNGIGTEAVKLNNGLQNASTRMKDIRGSFSFETSKGNGFKAILKFKA